MVLLSGTTAEEVQAPSFVVAGSRDPVIVLMKLQSLGAQDLGQQEPLGWQSYFVSRAQGNSGPLLVSVVSVEPPGRG